MISLLDGGSVEGWQGRVSAEDEKVGNGNHGLFHDSGQSRSLVTFLYPPPQTNP